MTSPTAHGARSTPVPGYRWTTNRTAGSACHASQVQLIRRQRPQRSSIHSQTVTYGPAARCAPAAAPDPGSRTA